MIPISAMVVWVVLVEVFHAALGWSLLAVLLIFGWLQSWADRIEERRENDRLQNLGVKNCKTGRAE